MTVTITAFADLYRRVGFVPPWIGYIAVVNNKGVGGGAFVGPPKDGGLLVFNASL